MEARGFTVLELVVVVGLIGCLAALAAWRAVAWLPDLRLDAATRQVMLDLRLTRGRAMAEQRYRRLAFDLGRDRYQPQKREGSTYDDDGAPAPLPQGIDLADCSAAGAAISFAPRGTAASFGTVVLRNSRGREKQVVVDIVGRVRVP